MSPFQPSVAPDIPPPVDPTKPVIRPHSPNTRGKLLTKYGRDMLTNHRFLNLSGRLVSCHQLVTAQHKGSND